MSASLLARSVRATVDLLLPQVCVSCDGAIAAHANGGVWEAHADGGAYASHDRGLVCALCWSRLAVLAAPKCARCGHPSRGRACRFCEMLPPFVRTARSVCWVPHDVGSAVVHALKYHGWTGAARDMATRMARLDWPPDVPAERAALIPVPLSTERERERGFNQAALLSDALSPHWRIPVWRDVLVRTRSTGTQTRLTPGERSANVHGAFAVPDGTLGPRERMRGLHLVIVDDVLTTGATLNACATALFNAGARTISYVTFGRARASGDR